MLEQPCSLLLDQLAHHIAEDGADRVESLIGGADVVQAIIVKEDLLHDEYGDSLAEFGSGLHDAQAERDNFGGQQEVDDLGRVVLDERANDTETSKPEVLERARLRRRIEKRVKVEGNMGVEEQGAGLVVGSHTLEQSQGITDPVGGGGGELGGVEEGVDGDDLLDKGGHDAKRMPQDQGELGDLLPLLTELEEGLLARVLVEQVGNVLHGATVILGHVWVVCRSVLVDGIQGVCMI